MLEDYVAAGDGLWAFGAALILPVQGHYCEGVKRSCGNVSEPLSVDIIVTHQELAERQDLPSIALHRPAN
jgi:hypothetical protein